MTFFELKLGRLRKNKDVETKCNKNNFNKHKKKRKMNKQENV